jgi:hypothetical protein
MAANPTSVAGARVRAIAKVNFLWAMALWLLAWVAIRAYVLRGYYARRLSLRVVALVIGGMWFLLPWLFGLTPSGFQAWPVMLLLAIVGSLATGLAVLLILPRTASRKG